MKFVRPVGAAADLREIEYISALHQTGETLRSDGSVSTEDVSRFLVSRYGLRVPASAVEETIARDFGGGDQLDLCEIMAMLLVPTLIKAEIGLHRDMFERELILAPTASSSSSSKLAGKEDLFESITGKQRLLKGDDRWPDANLIPFVLHMVLKDSTGCSEPKPLTVGLLKTIFRFYGEEEIAENDVLLEEMVSLAFTLRRDEEHGAEPPMFDAVTFAHCLTSDVSQYNAKAEETLSTNFDDVFVNSQHGQCAGGDSTNDATSAKRIFTFSSVDYAVDSFRSKGIAKWLLIMVKLVHDGTSAMVDTTRQNDKVAAEVMIWFMFACGVVLSLLTFQTILDTAIPQDYKDRHPLLKNVLASETVRMERSIKRAAAYKMNHLVRRAVKVHQAAEFEHGSGKDTSFGRALLAYGKTSNDQEEVGGFLYMYKRVWNGKLFDEDGIWLSNRMIQGMIAQFVICLWLVPFLQLIYGYITDFYGNIYADIAPPRWRILVPIIAGFTLGEFNAVKLMTSYIPSSAKTVLEFRTGALGSLHDAEFPKYRKSVDDASFIFGAMFWTWQLGVTTLYVLKRMVTLIAASFVFVGRIDVPFLSERADEIAGYQLDKFPFVFRKDMLLHEAHRHPYLDILGLIYMLKLRHKNDFGSPAGSCWRLLFVFALMPWLRKSRLRSDETKFGDAKFSQAGHVFQKFVSEKMADEGNFGRLTPVVGGEAPTGRASTKDEVDELKEVIERLKEENAFLRQQQRHSNRTAQREEPECAPSED
ncbi:hypothetical protein THAOC_05067 [Thalassiosira oceanica]|uniref:Uncharacterized protein n=1 Tax=Thalassiosira oceanica TaxID=159749 RepID=K0T3Q8_THAOC|nr:hypothetical protein THAOC_05067 [Thalassiosira oceanica]|eukprot:EJK73318.1 hypothetical protein THAOC_05067 [Thalassiosira oceanica]